MAFVTDGRAGIDLTDTPTVPTQTLGTRVKATDGQEYIYVQASGAITQYDAIGIDENYQAAALTKAMADDGYMIGFAQVAFANDDYGWIALTGSNMNVRVRASCAADVALYTTASAGVLDDSSTSQTKIEGIVLVAAGTSGGVSARELIATWPRSAGF